MARVAINGFGRIGRQSFKAMLEHYPDDLEIVAINDLTDNETLAHLLRHDSTYGAFDGDVSVTSDRISVTFYSEEGDERQIDIVALEERDPAKLPWRDLGIDIVIESTGRFTEAEKARAHLQAGRAQGLSSRRLLRARTLPSAWASTKIATITLSTISSPTPPAPPTVWRRWQRCSTTILASVAG
jgi:glyceraldehyde-3-phosphate dehydrogenase/erythrose-4-phosphate dehydrogenase